MTPEDLVRSLSTVPAKRLRLVELAREVCNEKGEMDPDKASERMDEIHVAIEEAGTYIQATQRVLWNLTELAR